VFDPRRPDDREWGERRAREFRAGPSGFDRLDARRDDWRDDRRDGPRFREDDRYRRDDRRRSPPRESRGDPPCMICRDRGYTNVMHTHATEQHARRSDRDAFSPRGGRGGRGGPFGDDSPRGGRGRGGPFDHGDRGGRGGLDSRLEAPGSGGSAPGVSDRPYCDVCQCVLPGFGTDTVLVHEQGKRHQEALAGRLAKRADADARK
jgi:hypothetical protein